MSCCMQKALPMRHDSGRFAADLFYMLLVVAITASGIATAMTVLDLQLADVIALAMTSKA